MNVLVRKLLPGVFAMAEIVWLGCARPVPPAPEPVSGPLIAQMDSFLMQGGRWLARDELVRAEEAYEMARQKAEGLDDAKGLIASLHGLGQVAFRQRDTSRAVRFHGRAVGLAMKLGDAGLLLESLTALGAAEHQAGHVRQAEDLYRRALEVSQQRKDRSAEAVLLNNLGLVRQSMGEDTQAEQLFHEALAVNQAMGNGASEASNHVNLGLLAEARQQYDVAEREYERALELDKDGERRNEIAADLYRLGGINDRRGVPHRALGYFERAYRSYLAQGNMPLAVRALTHAVESAGKSQLGEELARLQNELAVLKEAQGKR